MKSIKLVVTAALLLLATNALYAQTADDIIAKNIDAMGGKDKLSQVKSIYTEYSSDVMGTQAPGKTYMVTGKGYRNEIEFNGQKIIQCYNDKSGWNINEMEGSAAPQQMPASQYNYGKSQMYAGGALLDYAQKGNKAELAGKDKNNYKIKLTTPDNAEITYYIDSATHFITRADTRTNFQGQDIPVTITYSDYRKTDFGNFYPYKFETDLGQVQLASTVSKIEVNKDIDPKLFDK